MEECAAETRSAAGVLQDFVDEYQELSVAEWNSLEPQPDLSALEEDLTAKLLDIVESGCEPAWVDAAIKEKVDQVRGSGDLGRALAASVRGEDSPLGPPSPDPAGGRDAEPSTVRVASVDEFLQAIDTVAPGSTIEVAAGKYQLDEPLIIDVAVEIVGAGRDATSLRSSADGNGFVFLGPGDLTMNSLSMVSVGEQPATVFVTLVGGVRLSDVRVSGGTLADDGATGGHGVAFAFESVEGVDDRSEEELAGELVVEDSDISGNEAGGLLITGSAAPRITGNTINGNGRCGVCSAGRSGGVVSQNHLDGNAIGFQVIDSADPVIESNAEVGSTNTGAVVLGRATPTLRDNSFTEDEQIGVQVLGTANPRIVRNVVRSAQTVGFSFGEMATGVVRGNKIIGSGNAGILVGGSAAPLLRENTLRDGAVGIVYAGEGAGRAEENRVNDSAIGIQVTDSARPAVRRNVIVDSTEAAALYAGSARGRFVENTVSGSGSFGVQISEMSAPRVLANVFSEIGVASIVVADTTGGTISGNVCASGTGIALAETATVTIEGNDCDVVGI